MIDIAKSKELDQLETELRKLSEEYQGIASKKVNNEIEEFGKQFRDFFESKDLFVTAVTHNTSLRTRVFSTQIGRIKISLTANYSDSSLNYFELTWNDESSAKHNLVIRSNVNKRLYGFDIGRDRDTEKNIEHCRRSIETLKELIQSADKISFEHFLYKDNNTSEQTQISTLTSVLEKHFK